MTHPITVEMALEAVEEIAQMSEAVFSHHDHRFETLRSFINQQGGTCAENAHVAAPSASVTGDAVMIEPRFYLDHGMIHDRVTGKHVVTDGTWPYEDTVAMVCDLLNSLNKQPITDTQAVKKLSRTSASLTPPSPSVSGWMPIETAPKDGTKVDLWVIDSDGVGRRETNAYFVLNREIDGFDRHKGTRSGWYAPDKSYGEADWCENIEDGERATNWMPLPSAPNGGGNG